MKRPMIAATRLVLAIVLASCAGAPRAPVAPPDVSFAVDFEGIARFTEAYRIMRYETDERIRETVGAGYDSFALVDLRATRNRYMIGTQDAPRRQEIWIRGTANFRNALYDLEFARHRNAKLGINLHVGFEKMALAVYDDLRPRLKAGYDIVIFGHSLGAAEAVILGMLLDVDGWNVTRIWASGQPRVTDAEGERAFDHLPILRIVNVDDPVPYLPPRDLPAPGDPYVHIGPAVVLLDGAYYSLIGEDRGDEALAGTFWASLKSEGAVESVKDHLIPAYLDRLQPKIVRAVQVPYADRARYFTPQPQNLAR